MATPDNDSATTADAAPSPHSKREKGVLGALGKVAALKQEQVGQGHVRWSMGLERPETARPHRTGTDDGDEQPLASAHAVFGTPPNLLPQSAVAAAGLQLLHLRPVLLALGR